MCSAYRHQLLLLSVLLLSHHHRYLQQYSCEVNQGLSQEVAARLCTANCWRCSALQSLLLCWLMLLLLPLQLLSQNREKINRERTISSESELLDWTLRTKGASSSQRTNTGFHTNPVG